MAQECWAATAMEILGSADVELDLGVFPVIHVQLGIFITPSARVSQAFPFWKHSQKRDPSFILRDEGLLP